VVDFLDNGYVLRLQAFFALHDCEFNALTFIQITVSISYDGIVMNEQILAVFTFNETVAFATIEPLYGALLFFRHDLELLS
jgi:hypothetical protein